MTTNRDVNGNTIEVGDYFVLLSSAAESITNAETLAWLGGVVYGPITKISETLPTKVFVGDKEFAVASIAIINDGD